MNTLYPIIRRARRPLLPPDEPAPAIPPKAEEPSPVSSPVSSPVAPPVEAVVETAVEAALPARRSRKQRNRAETPAT